MKKGKCYKRALLRHTEGEGIVKVEVSGFWLGERISLYRIFDGDKDSDGFNFKHTDFIISLGNKENGKEFKCNTIDDVIKQSLSQYFYDRHICSYEKI